jgi:hypothetical protein
MAHRHCRADASWASGDFFLQISMNSEIEHHEPPQKVPPQVLIHCFVFFSGFSFYIGPESLTVPSSLIHI